MNNLLYMGGIFCLLGRRRFLKTSEISKTSEVYVLLSYIAMLFLGSCGTTTEKSERPSVDKEKQQAIIDKWLVDSARSYSYVDHEWQYYIDKGLAEDSTIAYLWQQKAMPWFKAGKYEVGMAYIDKVVKYDRQSW